MSDPIIKSYDCCYLTLGIGAVAPIPVTNNLTRNRLSAQHLTKILYNVGPLGPTKRWA